MLSKKVKLHELRERDKNVLPTYGRRDADQAVPKYEMPTSGLPARSAYSIVHDELMLDGNARLNLATFCTTWMEPEARDLMAETFDKNMIDKDEYPQTAEVELRCVNMLARLWHAPEAENSVGTSTIGSSEACMLGGMAFKWKWRERRKALGRPADRPNMVMGINVQVCWEKFCRYWDVEPRHVPVAEGRYVISPDEAVALCDENTIGIVGIMGSTYTGQYEPIAALDAAVDALNARTGWEVPIHVDGASGGFVAPFLQPELEWDFRLKWVKSINASGHKYGLVYPGVGWIVWRDHQELPEDLIFSVNYLGGEMPTFAINFSRPGNQVVAQYYNFLRLGREGYRRIHQNCQDVARYLAGEIEKLGPFELLSDGSDIPVFTWRLKKETNFTLFDLAERLHERGWQVPAYTLPRNCEDVAVQRVVVREGFSHDMAEMLLSDLRRQLEAYAEQPEHHHHRGRARFHH